MSDAHTHIEIPIRLGYTDFRLSNYHDSWLQTADTRDSCREFSTPSPGRSLFYCLCITNWGSGII